MMEEKGGGKKRSAELKLCWAVSGPTKSGAVLSGAYEIRPSGCQRLGQLAAITLHTLEDYMYGRIEQEDW